MKNQNKKIEEWEKRFDELCEEKRVPYLAVVPLFNFIRTLLQKERAEVINGAKEKAKPFYYSQDSSIETLAVKLQDLEKLRFCKNTELIRKKLITIKEAEDVWQKIGKNEFTLIHYPTFKDYWKECERINNLPYDEWTELMYEQSKKLK